MERFEAACGAGIADEATAGKAADFFRVLEREAWHVEEICKTTKAPVLAAGRALDRLLKTETSDRLAGCRRTGQPLAGRVSGPKNFRRASRARAGGPGGTTGSRRRCDDRHRHRRPRVARSGARARSGGATSGTRRHRRPAALARTRGETGVVADLKEEWTYAVVDAGLVPREWLMVDDRKMRGDPRAGRRAQHRGPAH